MTENFTNHSQPLYIFKRLHSSNAPSTTCDTRASSTNVNNTSYHHQATLALDIFTHYQKYTNRPTSGLYRVLYHLADPLCQAATANPQNVEHFIDYHLQPIATSIPSFIRDSLHFKSLLSDLDIRDSDILFLSRCPISLHQHTYTTRHCLRQTSTL